MSHKSYKREKHYVPLSQEQQDAWMKWQQDFKTVWPEIQKANVAAKRIWEETRDAPTWRIAETENVNNVEEPKMWTVGHAKVNYVDKIELSGEEQGDTE